MLRCCLTLTALGLLACTPSKPKADQAGRSQATAAAPTQAAPPAAPTSRPPGVKPHFVPCDPAHPELPCTPEPPPLALEPQADAVTALFTGASQAQLRGCATDSDCVLSCRRDGDCCPALCQCDIPYNVTSLERLTAHQAHCTRRGCPMAKCAAPEHELAPACVAGRCVAKKVPRKTR